MNQLEREILDGLNEALRRAANGGVRAGEPAFTTVEDAVKVVPDMAGAFDEDGATFDQLFEARYGRKSAQGNYLKKGDPERAALEFLYPRVREKFQNCRGRIQEEYWCTTFPAGAIRTIRDRTNASDFNAIVNWKQDDEKFVEQIFKLNEIEVGTHFLPEGAERRRAGRLIFDAYSSALDALETRHDANPPQNQDAELELIKKQVEIARKFFQNAAKRFAQAETLRGLAPTLVILLSVAAVVGTFFWAIGVDSTSSPGRLLTWGVAGAIGACLSVIVRIAREDYTPNWEASKPELQVAGAIRPLVGLFLGAMIPILVISGLQTLATDINDPNDVKTQFVLLSLAVAAGFSERWAQDLIAKQPSVLGSEKADGTAAAT